jgi:DNA-binding SARP family transcriptional activator
MVSINPSADFWLDVDLFETAYARADGLHGHELDDTAATALSDAVELYKGDLLGGCYQGWCLCERRRLQDMYLSALYKLMCHWEARGDYEASIFHGKSILRCDSAQERTHRRLMRLHYLTGDRTAALRQYEQCVCALREELGVKPAQSTVSLYEQIRADQLDGAAGVPIGEIAGLRTIPHPSAIVADLKYFGVILGDLQRRVYQNMQALEELLGRDY